MSADGKRRRRRAARLAFVGGILILLGGGTGSAALYLGVLALAAHEVATLGPLVEAATVVLPYLAGLGGLTVIVGAWIVLEGRTRTGGLLIDLGSGLGLLGFLLGLWRALASEDGGVQALIGAFAGLTGLGLLLVLASRTLVLPWHHVASPKR